MASNKEFNPQETVYELNLDKGFLIIGSDGECPDYYVVEFDEKILSEARKRYPKEPASPQNAVNPTIYVLQKTIEKGIDNPLQLEMCRYILNDLQKWRSNFGKPDLKN
jgi:hypothetical protein